MLPNRTIEQNAHTYFVFNTHMQAEKLKKMPIPSHYHNIKYRCFFAYGSQYHPIEKIHKKTHIFTEITIHRICVWITR